MNHRHPSSSLIKNVRKRSQRKAAEMASREIDRLTDQAATSEEQARRKRRLNQRDPESFAKCVGIWRRGPTKSRSRLDRSPELNFLDVG
jgi:hypothetical protein